MESLAPVFMVLLTITFLKFFPKKLIVLLMLEAFMMTIIYLYSWSNSFVSVSYLFLVLMMVLMVLDSVLGVSILILSSRNSTYESPTMFIL